jgi:hypothetical protein
MSKLDMPWHAVPGNHETLEGTWEDYRMRLGRPLHYVFEHADCQFILLNGSRDEKNYTSAGLIDDDQLRWLERELRGGQQRLCTFVVCHFPLQEKWGGHGIQNPARDRILDLLRTYRVSGFLFGHRHAHDYVHADGTTHVLCAGIGWNFRDEVGYRVYRVYPEMTVSYWKVLGDRPPRFRATLPNPRRIDVARVRNPRADVPTAATQTEPGLLCHLRFEGCTDGQIPDTSGNGNAGAVEVADWLGPQWVDRGGGTGLALDGMGDHVRISHRNGLPPGEGPFTVALWFRKTDAGDTFLSLLYKHKPGGHEVRGFGLMLRETGGELKFTLSDGQAAVQACGPPIRDSEWHHVAAARGGGKVRLYLDGRPAGGADDALGDIANEYPILVGRAGCGNNVGGPSNARAWLGAVDDLRLYARTLTANEIKRLADR